VCFPRRAGTRHAPWSWHTHYRTRESGGAGGRGMCRRRAISRAHHARATHAALKGSIPVSQPRASPTRMVHDVTPPVDARFSGYDGPRLPPRHTRTTRPHPPYRRNEPSHAAQRGGSGPFYGTRAGPYGGGPTWCELPLHPGPVSIRRSGRVSRHTHALPRAAPTPCRRNGQVQVPVQPARGGGNENKATGGEGRLGGVLCERSAVYRYK
jgi:hypothetical protein